MMLRMYVLQMYQISKLLGLWLLRRFYIFPHITLCKIDEPPNEAITKF